MRLRKVAFHSIVSTLMLLQKSTAAAQIKILAVGDSMVEFMGQSLESFCADAKVYNAGIGGTTATQWASYSKDDISGCGMDWDVVYISVGGNDLLESGCTIESSELKNRIEKAVSNVVQNLAPQASTYVLTGYCTPYAPEEDLEQSGCSNPSGYVAMSDAIRNLSTDAIGLPSNASLEVIDSSSVCGGSATSFSNEAYFQDPIHLNAKGYCKVFSQPSVQSALKCSRENGFDCDSLDNAQIFGLESNCITSFGSKLMVVRTIFILNAVLIMVVF